MRNNLINEARRKAGVRNPGQKLSEEKHNIALAHVKNIFEARHINNWDLANSIREVKNNREAHSKTKTIMFVCTVA